MDKSTNIPGVWQAYVTSGKTAADRRDRLSEVPEHLSEVVRSHVNTVFRIKKGE